METNLEDNPRYRMAKKKVKAIKGFYIHLLVYLFINIAIVLVSTQSLFGADSGLEVTNLFTPFFWGIGLFAHWASVFGKNIFFGSKWEKRKIEEFMAQQQYKRNEWE